MISGDAQVTVQQGLDANCIGDGFKGNEVEPDLSGLTVNGFLKYLDVDGNLIKTAAGKVVPVEPEEPEEPTITTPEQEGPVVTPAEPEKPAITPAAPIKKSLAAPVKSTKEKTVKAESTAPNTGDDL